MNYDIYHSSITYFPLLPLSKTASFERKVLDIRQMPAQVLFLIGMMNLSLYMFSGMMEFRVRQEGFSGFFWRRFLLNTGRFIPLVHISLMTAALLSTGSAASVLFQTEDNPLYQKYIKPLVNHPSFGF